MKGERRLLRRGVQDSSGRVGRVWEHCREEFKREE